MKKFILYIIVCTAALVSCTKSGPDIASGNVVDEIYVSADAGRMTISVETAGRWIVYEADGADWLEFDVMGGLGNGAFTMTWQSNMSDVVDLKSSRKARVVITSEDYAKSDTLNLIQQGFYSQHQPSEVQPYKDIVLEYEEHDVKTLKVVYCSADGVEDMQKLSDWAQQFDIVACGNAFLKPEVASDSEYAIYDSEDGIRLVSADYSMFHDFENPDDEYIRFRSLVDQTYNSEDSPSKCIIGGQLYHLSMMQTANESTPSDGWYPSDIDNPLFSSDRYAWNNNLYDCLWMACRDYVTTWTSDDGSRSYMADYVYVSRSVLATVCSVRKLDPVHGMRHNPIEITLMY